MAVSSYSEGGADDPLIRLRDRMRRELRPVRPSVADPDQDDPLARLDELIARAHDLDADELAEAPEPLASLYETIDRARDLEAAEPPEATGDDPIDTIRTWIAREADELGARHEPAPRVGGATVPASTDASLEAMLGREVLAMVADEPLSPEARAEAVRLVAEALQNPSKSALKRVLRTLIAG